MNLLRRCPNQLRIRQANLSRPFSTITLCSSIRHRVQARHSLLPRAQPQRSFSEKIQTKPSNNFNWKAAVLFLLTGLGLTAYLRYEKQQLEEKKKQEAETLQNQSVGRPKIGGPFELINQHGQLVKSVDWKDDYLLVYFGFTHCPDICPDELDKMSEVIDKLEKDDGVSASVLPIFITCDPWRDKPEIIKEYLKDFHPKFVGLTGSVDSIAKVAKAYRVYFSRPTNIKPGEDYLVDHSIFFYLMSPEGEFIECYGKNSTAEEAYVSIKKEILAREKDNK